jgi:hypothetical protein
MTNELPTLETVIQLYPRLYSEKRLDEWVELFDENATVARVESGGKAVCSSIREAMPEQREYAADNEIFGEAWEAVQVHRYGQLAIIKADYILTVDNEERRGVDVLTLVFGTSGWKITHLAYEQKCLTQR